MHIKQLDYFKFFKKSSCILPKNYNWDVKGRMRRMVLNQMYRLRKKWSLMTHSGVWRCLYLQRLCPLPVFSCLAGMFLGVNLWAGGVPLPANTSAHSVRAGLYNAWSQTSILRVNYEARLMALWGMLSLKTEEFLLSWRCLFWPG